MAETTVTMNFLRDLAEIIRGKLMSAGYSAIPGETDEDSIRRFLNVLHRRVSVAKRRTFMAKDFACPPEHQAGLDALAKTSEAGGDLRPYQSTRLDDANFNDGMLNDFGLQHFHLGVGPYPKNPSYVDRTGPVLYALVTEDGLYWVGVLPHQEWSRQELLDVIYENWPDLLTLSELQFPAGPSPEKNRLAFEPSDEEVKKLRKHQINTPTKRKDGTIHFAPGGGTVAIKAGIQSLRVNRAVDWFVLTMQGCEEEVKARAVELVEAGEAAGPFEFKVVEDAGGQLYAYDPNAKIAIKCAGWPPLRNL